MASPWRCPLVLLASLGGEGCTREELGWDKHWASSEPHPGGGPGILAKSDLRWSTEEKGRSRVDWCVNGCLGPVNGICEWGRQELRIPFEDKNVF